MFRNKKSLIALATGIVVGIAASVGSGVLAEREKTADSLPWEEARLLAEVLERVKQEYVEPVEDRILIESAVRGMVTDLDPHSQFLDPEQYEEIRVSTTGNYSGVGLEVSMDKGTVSVVAPIEGTAAQRAGIRAGDVILTIDGIVVDERNVHDAVGRMRGKPGTTVELTVSRDAESEPIDFSLMRGHVQVSSVRTEILDDTYGYIRITHFSETTARDLRKAVAKLRKTSVDELDGVILDLRNNPGGVLDAAVDVSDAFLNGGIIVTANGRGHDATFRHEAVAGDLLDGILLVVMVNRGSASASEIVAGALQDNERATVVGDRTFGKGSVQTVMPLSNGRAIKLTTSRYFTPSGDSIQGQGITPDIILEEGGLEDMLAGAAEHRTDPGAAMLQSDRQLRQALNVLKGGRILQSRID